ncbi:uncharacterized protein LOC130770078 [Actinidia eriantha]|uniref:uncharacterized protein LOC130770078 n=1 Tax=Actinidia eriantha TaxID=165200 RepID=UPI002589A99C|nr:uncharacterized protein LOC130770078 [Actinidia eriantha]
MRFGGGYSARWGFLALTIAILHRVIGLNSVSGVCELSVVDRNMLYNYSLASPIRKYPHGVLSEDGFYKVAVNETVLWFQATQLRHPSGCAKIVSVHGKGLGWFGTFITIILCLFGGYLVAGGIVYRFFYLGVRGIDDYNATIEFYWAPFLLESNSDDAVIHRVSDRLVRRGSINKHGRYWKGADILVFNTYLW